MCCSCANSVNTTREEGKLQRGLMRERGGGRFTEYIHRDLFFNLTKAVQHSLQHKPLSRLLWLYLLYKKTTASLNISDAKRDAQWFTPLFVQALGNKPAIAPSTPDDEKVDSANRKKGALYMVSNKTDNQANPRRSEIKLKRYWRNMSSLNFTLWEHSWCVMPSLCFADLWCIWFDEGVLRGSIQSLQAGHVVSWGVLHPGQRGGREHICLERCRPHHRLNNKAFLADITTVLSAQMINMLV